MTMTLMLWAVAGLAGTWLGCAYFYQRKIDRLQLLHKADRQGTAERFKQARHQIGLLQAELAGRPPGQRRTPPIEDRPSWAAALRIDRTSTNEDGFPSTMIGPQGFVPTQRMR